LFVVEIDFGMQYPPLYHGELLELIRSAMVEKEYRPERIKVYWTTQDSGFWERREVNGENGTQEESGRS